MRNLSVAALLLSAAVLALGSARGVQAGLIERTIEFDAAQVRTSQGSSALSVSGCPEVGLPGQPLLPARGLSVLLPQGEEVASVTATVTGETEIALEYALECAQQQYPLSSTGPHPMTQPNPAIYGSTEAFPESRAVHVTTEIFRGYNLAFIRVYPVLYVGADGVLLAARTVRVTIETRPSAGSLSRSAATLRPGRERDLTALGGLTDDVSEASTYQAGGPIGLLSSLVDPDDTYPYVIITNSTLQASFQPLKQLKEGQGYRTKIVLVSDISAGYSGADLQAKIRNFIIDAYQNWETEYVMLGGDNDIIPHRGLYADAGGTIDADIAADLYYMALDGNWNTDGDSYWGEPAEADLIPEVSCGRAAVGTVTEAANFINKIRKYQLTPVTGQIQNALMVGELLWDDPTWGGDYKDEIKNGSSNHGYTTVGFPGTFNVGTLYDRDLDPDSWDKEDLLPLMNGGRHIVNHLGHSNVTYGLRLYNSDVDTRFTNNGVTNTYNVIYTQGCYSGSFDNRTSSGSYTEDCIGEHLCFIANGAVAFVGNTRYGWGAHSSTRGASQYYDRQFFDAIFGEGITLLGPADVDSRVDNIPFIDATSAGRWVYYELVVMGDPAMDIWTDAPGTLAVELPAVILVGQNQVTVRALATPGGPPVEGARVSLLTDSTYSFGLTDAAGYAYVDPLALEPGEIVVTISAHDFYTYCDTLDVVEATEAFLILSDFPIDDDGTGGSSGNGNGGVDAGETIEALIELANIGQATATGVTATLRCTNPNVSLLDTTATFGPIAPDQEGTAFAPFRFSVDPQVPDGEMLNFEVFLSCDDTTSTAHISFPAMAPELVFGDLSYYDSVVGNNDGCIEAGERFELYVVFVNSGSGPAEDAAVILTCSDPYAAVLQDSSHLSLVPSGGQGETDPAFVVSVDLGCPAFHQILFDIDIYYASGRHGSAGISVSTGGLLADNVESGVGAWTHAVVNDGFVDEWHLETYRNHTGGGTTSWKCGGAGSATYTDFSNGALVTPVLCLGPDATLTFWHWMDCELYGGGSPPYAWDGGIVEISTDNGASWTQIAPEGGYPYRIYPNTASPFGAETPCFAATSGWEQETFDLSLYTGGARIRFQFGSDGYVTEEGWYIDDIQVTADLASVPVDPDRMEPAPTVFALRIADRNPVTSAARIAFDVPSRGPVAVAVYDVSGRTVDTLADAVYEPGRYSCEWQADRVSPGVYFLQMKAPGFEKTHKLVTVR